MSYLGLAKRILAETDSAPGDIAVHDRATEGARGKYTEEARELYEGHLAVCRESGVAPRKAEHVACEHADAFVGIARLLDEAAIEIVRNYDAGAWPWAMDSVRGYSDRYCAAEDRFDELARRGAAKREWQAAIAEWRALWTEAVQLYRTRVPR